MTTASAQATVYNPNYLRSLTDAERALAAQMIRQFVASLRVPAGKEPEDGSIILIGPEGEQQAYVRTDDEVCDHTKCRRSHEGWQECDRPGDWWALDYGGGPFKLSALLYDNPHGRASYEVAFTVSDLEFAADASIAAMTAVAEEN